MGILSAWLKREQSKPWWKAVITVWVLLISISVCFVKQHSFTDVWAAGVMCALIEIVLFRKYWMEKIFAAKRQQASDKLAES